MRWRTPSTLWELRLSITTTSPGCRAGHKTSSRKGEEYLPVCGRLDGHGSDHAAAAHGAKNGENLPVTFRCALVNPYSTQCACIQTRHARGDTALIKKDQLFRRDRAETFNELFSPTTVFFPVPFAGVE